MGIDMKKKSLYILTISLFYMVIALINNPMQAIPNCNTEHWYCTTGVQSCEWWIYTFQGRTPDQASMDACNKALTETQNVHKACPVGCELYAKKGLCAGPCSPPKEPSDFYLEFKKK
jgi:hypothetical protein